VSLSTLRTALTSKVGLQTLVVKKHSPAILLGVGVVGMGATVVLACRATLRVDAVLREAEENEAKFKKALDLAAEGKADYTEEEAKREGLTNKVQLAVKIAKLYAPAIIVGGITLAAMTGSYRILNTRNAGITAAYAGMDKAFREYRNRVIAKHGKEADDEFRFGRVEKQIGVETDQGVAEKTVAMADPDFAEATGGRSMYARLFSRETSTIWSPHVGRNVATVRAQQEWANNMLNAYGYLLLNDVYKMLGMEQTSAGAVVGWVRNNDRGGDNYIDFGVLDDRFEAMRFISGDEQNVWLDFNVDGVVYDLIDKVSK
jgi:hypothetical protein